MREGHDVHRWRKNSGFDFVLKGRGFQPRRKCCKINPGFSRRGRRQPCNNHFFRSLVQSCYKSSTISIGLSRWVRSDSETTAYLICPITTKQSGGSGRCGQPNFLDKGSGSAQCAAVRRKTRQSPRSPILTEQALPVSRRSPRTRPARNHRGRRRRLPCGITHN